MNCGGSVSESAGEANDNYQRSDTYNLYNNGERTGWNWGSGEFTYQLDYGYARLQEVDNQSPFIKGRDPGWAWISNPILGQVGCERHKKSSFGGGFQPQPVVMPIYDTHDWCGHVFPGQDIQNSDEGPAALGQYPIPESILGKNSNFSMPGTIGDPRNLKQVSSGFASNISNNNTYFQPDKSNMSGMDSNKGRNDWTNGSWLYDRARDGHMLYKDIPVYDRSEFLIGYLPDNIMFRPSSVTVGGIFGNYAVRSTNGGTRLVRVGDDIYRVFGTLLLKWEQ